MVGGGHRGAQRKQPKTVNYERHELHERELKTIAHLPARGGRDAKGTQTSRLCKSSGSVSIRVYPWLAVPAVPLASLRLGVRNFRKFFAAEGRREAQRENSWGASPGKGSGKAVQSLGWLFRLSGCSIRRAQRAQLQSRRSRRDRPTFPFREIRAIRSFGCWAVPSVPSVAL